MESKRAWKKVAGLIMASILALSVAGCGGGEEKSASSGGSGDYSKLKAVEMIGADSAGKGAAGQQFGELVAKNVEKITGGKFKIDYHLTLN